MSVMDYDSAKRRASKVICSCSKKFSASVTDAEYEERLYLGTCPHCERRGYMLILNREA